MEELKQRLRAVTERQKIELTALIFIGTCVIIATFFVFKSLNRTEYTSEQVDILHRANMELSRNNAMLIGTVNNLNSTITSRLYRDSVFNEQIVENSRLLPGINSRINEIDKNYEKSISAPRSYSVNDIESYIAGEAARLRRSQ